MPVFSKNSLDKLSSCDTRLVRLFNEVVLHCDCTVMYGHRSIEEQGALFKAGKSKLPAGKSKHNVSPSMAADVAPYPIDFNDTKRFYYFAGLVKGVAAMQGIEIRWGGDWDSDNDFNDQTFNDLVHFEIKE